VRAYHAALLGLMAAGTVAATGCGSSDESPTKASAATTGAKPAKVAFLTAAITDYTKAEIEGLKKAFEADGGSLTVMNSNFDPTKLQSQCNDAITSGRYNALIVSVFEPPAGVPCAKAAARADLPVVAADVPIGTDYNQLEPQVDGVVGGVYITAESNGAAGAKLVKQACGDINPCKVIAEVVTPTDQVTGQIVKDLKKDPQIKVVQVLATHYDPAEVAKQLPDALAAHPDTNVFVAGADSQALAALPAVKSSGRDGKLIVLGQGGSRLGAEAIADGSLGGSVGSWPLKEAVAMAKMVQQTVNGQQVEPNGISALTMGTPLILTKANIAQFTPEWGAQHSG
jgi:ribose transport system substrate-binding protein